MARKRIHLRPAISRGHAGLGVILAKDSVIELQNAQIRRMISKITLPAMIIRETTKETAAEIMAAMVDKDHQDRAIEAEPQKIKTLRALMRSMVVEWLMRIPTGQMNIQKRGHSSMRVHTDPQAAMVAGSLIAGRQACPPEISPYLSTWIRVKVTSLLRVGSVCL